LRSKGRFLSISKLGKCGEKIIEVMAVKGRAKKGCLLDRLRQVLPALGLLKPFIIRFANNAKTVAHWKFLKIRDLTRPAINSAINYQNNFPTQKSKNVYRVGYKNTLKFNNK
jgi:hypothetical protein